MRLIDADALLDKFEWKEDGPLYIRALRTMIEAAPTIYAVQHTDDVIQRMQDIKQAQIEKAYDLGYDLGYAEGKADAEPQWIPVTERLPERETAVLITDEDEEVNVAYWDYEEWVEDPIIEWRCGNWNVKPVAWMPLPKPYEAERKEK